MAKRRRWRGPYTPSLIPGLPMFDPFPTGLNTSIVSPMPTSAHYVSHVAPGLGDSAASMVLSALYGGVNAARNTFGGSPVSIFTPTTGGSAFDSFLNQASNLAMNIIGAKQQTKLLKQLAKAGRMGGGSPLNLAALAGSSALGFSGVPAASAGAGGSLGLGPLLGGALGSLGTSVLGGGLGLNLPGGLEEVGSGTGVFGLDMFEPGKTSQRARRLLMANNPTTGNPTFWRHVGSPVLFSGDLALNKRIQKIASRAGRGGRRCATFRRRRR